MTPEPPDPPQGCHARDLSSGRGVPAPTLAHNDGLIRSMSTAGSDIPVVWLITGLPRRDFSPGLTPAMTSNPISDKEHRMSSLPATVADLYR